MNFSKIRICRVRPALLTIYSICSIRSCVEASCPTLLQPKAVQVRWEYVLYWVRLPLTCSTSAINNNQLTRLEILEAMLQRNAKILYAPNVTVVDQVIAKVTSDLNLIIFFLLIFCTVEVRSKVFSLLYNDGYSVLMDILIQMIPQRRRSKHYQVSPMRADARAGA